MLKKQKDDIRLRWTCADFSDKQVFVSAENDISEVCNELFRVFYLKFFSYGRFYNDGKCILLGTNKNVFINHFKKKHQLFVLPKKYENKNCNEFYNIIQLDDGSPQIYIDEYKLFDHGTTFDIVKTYKKYYEVFCFAAKKSCIDPVNMYFNNIDNFELFANDFEKNAAKIIKSAENDLIYLPESMRVFLNDLHLSNKYNIDCDGSGVNLTKRQFQCLSLLAVGKSTKEIARILDLTSSRTVESHLEVVKEKVNLNYRSELIKLGLKNNLHYCVLCGSLHKNFL